MSEIKVYPLNRTCVFSDEKIAEGLSVARLFIHSPDPDHPENVVISTDAPFPTTAVKLAKTIDNHVQFQRAAKAATAKMVASFSEFSAAQRLLLDAEHLSSSPRMK